MWIVRGIVGLLFIFLAIIVFLFSFEKPILIVVVMALTVLGLWVMGYISRFAPKRALEQDAEEEIKIRSSPGFDIRNRAMGVVALALGAAITFVIVQEGDWLKNWKALLGGIMFILMGTWYLFKGRKAEGDAYNRALTARSKVDAP